MKKASKIIGYILNILIVLVIIVIILAIYYFVQIKVLNKPYANIFGYTFFEVATGSMEPTIHVGDVIIVKITNDIEENDIIVCKENNSFITHRLLEIQDNKLITKGDANNTEDNPIEESDVLGKVVNTIPHIGIWRKAILSPEVIGLVGILVLILISSFIYTSKTEEKND